MAEDIVIRIQAQDNASEAFRRAGEQLGLLGDQADNTKRKAASLTSGLSSLSSGSAQLVGGFSVLGNGFGGLVAGMTSIQAGAANIRTGFSAISGSASALAVGLGVGLVGAATALGAAVFSTVSRTAELGDKLRDMSLQSGVSVESLSTLKFAAEQSNIGLEDLNSGLRFLSRNAVEAADGTGEQARAFRDLGVGVTDASGHMRSADAIMLDVADGLRSLASDTDRSALAVQIFGRSGTQLLPFLREGSAGIQEMQQRAKELGLEMSTDTANAADAFGDSLDELKAVFGSVSQRIGSALLPMFAAIIRALVDVATSVGDTGVILKEFGLIAFEPLRQGFAIAIDYIREGIVTVINFLGTRIETGINAIIGTFNEFGQAVGVTVDTIDFTPLTVDAPQTMSARWDESKRRVTEGFDNIQAASDRIASRFENNPLGVISVEQGTRQIARTIENDLIPRVGSLDLMMGTLDDDVSDLSEEFKMLDRTVRETVIEFPMPPPPPPNQFMVYVRNFGQAFTDPAGKDVIQTALINAFTDISQGGSFTNAIAAVGVAIGTAIGGPLGGAIAGLVTQAISSIGRNIFGESDAERAAAREAASARQTGQSQTGAAIVELHRIVSARLISRGALQALGRTAGWPAAAAAINGNDEFASLRPYGEAIKLMMALDPQDPRYRASEEQLRRAGYIISAQHGLWDVPGPEFQAVPATLHGGEMVVPARQAEAIRSGRDLAGGVTVNFYLQSASDREMVQMIRSQLPMIEQAVSDGIRRGARFGTQEFDSRMIRSTLQS